jgi:hypothetical protein
LPNLLAAIAVIAFTDASKTARCYHLAKKLKGGRHGLVGTHPTKRLPVSSPEPPPLNRLRRGSDRKVLLRRCISPVGYLWGMPTDTDNVCSSG